MASKEQERKEKIKRVVHKLKAKRKTEGKPKIKGVKEPNKKETYIQKLKREKSQREHGHKRPTQVGPHGGVYAETAGGKKDYAADKKTPKGVDRGATVKQRLANNKQKRIKKALEEILALGDTVKAFIKQFKGENDNE